jgi:hypothetical protein
MGAATMIPPASVADLIERHRREIPGWGHLSAAMRLKQAAVSSVGVDAAFGRIAAHLEVPGVDHLRRRPLGRLADAARQAPVFRALWDGGESFTDPELRVIGSGNHRTMRGTSRSGWLACLEDVDLRGRSSLLTRRGVVLIDNEPWEMGCIKDNPEYDPGVLHAQSDAFWMMEAAEPLVRLDEAFLLSGSHANDFGHWITEYLPKLGMALMAGWDGGMPVLVDERIPATIRDALPQLLPRGCILIPIPHLGAAQVRRLWCVPNPSLPVFYPTEWNLDIWDRSAVEPHRFARILRQVHIPGVADAPLRSERLYLARRLGRKKVLQNHAEIEAVAERHGFAKIYPEDFSFFQQVQLMRQARHVLAPEGSNSLLAMFCEPGARLCTLSPTYTHPLVDINALLTALGIEGIVFTGPEVPDVDWPFWCDYRVDEGRFEQFLPAWLAGGPAAFEQTEARARA